MRDEALDPSSENAEVHSHNEWDPLEEVIVGRAEHAQIPPIDRSLFTVEFQDYYSSPSQALAGPFPAAVIEETVEDLEVLCSTLNQLGVVVRRPDIFDHARSFSTPFWETSGIYNYCPRDLLLIIGALMIETPMAVRARWLETLSFRELLLQYFLRGAKWMAAPKPVLLDESFMPGGLPEERLSNSEPIFDAANVLRMGKDLLYLISSSGNSLGADWLARMLGNEYRIWPCRNLYAATHLDSTISLLRPGLVLLNPERVKEATIPEPLKRWDRIWCPEMIDTGFVGRQPYSSVWVGMNILMVSPKVAIVEKSQRPLIRELAKHNVEVIPLPLRHSRTLGGGFHCVTLDIRRMGALEDYR